MLQLVFLIIKLDGNVRYVCFVFLRYLALPFSSPCRPSFFAIYNRHFVTCCWRAWCSSCKFSRGRIAVCFCRKVAAAHALRWCFIFSSRLVWRPLGATTTTTSTREAIGVPLGCF